MAMPWEIDTKPSFTNIVRRRGIERRTVARCWN